MIEILTGASILLTLSIIATRTGYIVGRNRARRAALAEREAILRAQTSTLSRIRAEVCRNCVPRVTRAIVYK